MEQRKNRFHTSCALIVPILSVCAILAIAILPSRYSFSVKEIDRGYSGGERAWLLVKVTNTGASVDWVDFNLRRPQWMGVYSGGYVIIYPDGSTDIPPIYMKSGFSVRINFTYTTIPTIYDPDERFQIEICTTKPHHKLGTYDIG